MGGHIFCRDCIKHWMQINWLCTCPNCKEEGCVYQPCRFVHRQINQLNVRCVHMDKSCKWIGQISEFKRHLISECEHRDEFSLCCICNELLDKDHDIIANHYEEHMRETRLGARRSGLKWGFTLGVMVTIGFVWKISSIIN